jgi:hypothetical protein
MGIKIQSKKRGKITNHAKRAKFSQSKLKGEKIG